MSFLRSIRELAPGDHACLVYDSPARRDELLLEYFEEGIRRGEAVVFIDSGDGGSIASELERRAAPGQLTLLPAAEAFFREGTFDPNAVLADWHALLDDALARGFASIRAAGGPPFAVTCNGHSHELSHYERRAADLFLGGAFGAMCTYGVRETVPGALVGIVDAHPVVLYAVEDDDRLGVESTGSHIAPRGWIDLTTLGKLVAPLSAAMAIGGDVEVDLRDVDFVDVAGWRLFDEAAGMLLGRGRKLTIRSAPEWAPKVLRLLGYGADNGLVLV